ncbi:MAG: hypothetical protein SGCHY_000104 [Lobulomycetales sp.]
MGAVAEQIKAIDPLIPFVYSVMIGDSPKQDADAGFFDIVSRQVAHVCETLSEVALCLLTKQVHGLEHGFNAVGFSQYKHAIMAQRSTISLPWEALTRIKLLSKFTSSGVAEIPRCGVNSESGDSDNYWSVSSATCSLMSWYLSFCTVNLDRLVKRGVFLPYIQHKIVQAQYFRGMDRDAYLAGNIFLPDLNNELEINMTYIERLKSLNMFAMIQFDQDTMVTPKNSAWFGYVDSKGREFPISDTPQYGNDSLGLGSLDSMGKLRFISWEGDHLHLPPDGLEIITREFLSRPQTPQKYADVRLRFQ